MNRSRDQRDTIRTKLEDNNNNNSSDKLFKAIANASSSSSSIISTSRQWSRLRNPRIVRVSRTFGGKDRHSKVCTIRGLRDRRIRLSVSTAIQLYDLQDRLGLSQPSKVIDWLLEATKLDIDELPPLQFPPSNFAQLANAGAPPHLFTPYLGANLTLMNDIGPTHNSTLSSVILSSKGEININGDLDYDDDKINEKDEEEKLDYYQGGVNRSNATPQLVSPQLSFSPFGGRGTVLPNLTNSSSVLPNSNLYHWDHSSLYSSQFASSGFLVPSEESNYQSNSYSGGSTHRLFFCPPMQTPTTPLFPQHDSRFHPSNTSLPAVHSRSGAGMKALALHDQLPLAGDSDGNQLSKAENGTEL